MVPLEIFSAKIYCTNRAGERINPHQFIFLVNVILLQILDCSNLKRLISLFWDKSKLVLVLEEYNMEYHILIVNGKCYL